MSIINDLQRKLSIAQALPIVGPLVASPVKAVVSVAQIIYGIARATFFGIGTLSAYSLNIFFHNNYKISNATEFLGKQMGYGFLDQFNGTCSLIYSLSNLFTLGVTGFVCERTWSQIQIAYPSY